MLKLIMIMTITMIMKNKNLVIPMTMITMLHNMSIQTSMNSKTSYMLSTDLASFWISSMSMMMFFTLIFTTTKNQEMMNKISIIMLTILILTFNVWNFMAFYMMFEMSMIIVLIIIISWSYQPERTEAMMFMIIMTLMFSLPFMITMMTQKKNLNFWLMEMNLHLMTFVSFLFIFMMKMPIYFIHFWLPKVHVEAPIQGSMILAAILLKLGCYGMMRMNKVITKFNMTKPLIMSISAISMAVLSMNCIMQIDLKTLIAYSSIVHMTMVFMNIMLMKPKSMFSSMLIIIGHGMTAAALFSLANSMYEMSKSRSILMNKGILNLTPSMTLMWFTACMNNAPMPPSMNMLGELMSFKNITSWSLKMYYLIIPSTLLSSMYSIYLFCIPSQGKFSKMTNTMKTKVTKNAMKMTMMMLPITLMTTKSSMMMMM